MVLTIASFEFRQRMRRISTYVYFVVFTGLGFLFILISGGAIPGASADFGTGGKVLVNSPYALDAIITFVSFFGLVVTAAIAGQATYQDVDNHSTDFFFTAPISKLDYLGGRFLGALAIQIVIFSSVGLGVWLATHMPWLDPTRLGPQIAAAYFQPYLILVLPNLFLTTAIFFGLAALARKMLPVYAGSVLLLIGYFVAQQLSTNLTVNMRAALADPFGSNALDRLTQYWTPFQRNTQLVPMTGVLLLNRALWVGVGGLILLLTYLRFSLSYAGQRGRGKRVTIVEQEIAPLPARSLPVVHPAFSAAASLWQFFSLTRIHFTETVKNVFFAVLLLAGGVFAIFTANGINSPFSTQTYPVTYEMLSQANGGIFIFAFAIIVFYSGELVWRERDAGLNQIVDALPVERWVLFASKLAALMLVQVVTVLITMAAGLTVQVWHGYYHFQLGLYFTDLFGIRLVQYWILCVLAMLVQTLVNNKYLGHFMMVLYFVATVALPAMGLQNFLYRFGQSPPYVYSDMNGYGPFVAPLFWFRLYWAIAAIALALLTNLFWVRDTESSLRTRLQLARERLSRPAVAGFAVCCFLFLGVGGYIFYNTGFLNHYRTTYRIDDDRAQYEKKYRQQYKDMPHPRITDVSTQIDLDPAKSTALVQGTMMLENKTSKNIDRVAVTVWPQDLTPLSRGHIEIRKLTVGGAQTPVLKDDNLGFYVYQLPSPLPPHGHIAMEYAVEYANVGFENSNPNTDIVSNGSFLNSAYAPFVGYWQDVELTDDSTRHKHGLDNAKRMPKLEDVAARSDNGISNNADWINFEGTVSTSPDQIAILPGYLQKEWVADGRRYFYYKMAAPILSIESMNSARYAVRRDRWRDVSLEIYYQPGHEFDLDRMMDGMKSTLEYCSTNFSPFQFHQERIIEFPRYATFAESFPNTIPFSENIGFITYVDPKDPDAIDIPFYVTSHEVGHQWWAHQVISANVEGADSIDETLSQYTALMVMKHRYGLEGMRKFLRYSLDQYLRGRAQERNEEPSLERSEANQGYLYYGKGAVVMYAIQDYIGEDKVNQALAEFVKAFAFKGAPYPVSLDLVAYLKKYTPPEYQYLYSDLWENITLYDNRARSAKYFQLPDGRYQVDLVVEARKSQADAKGQDHAVNLHDWMDVGVLDDHGHYLYLQRQKIEQERNELTLIVDKVPAQAGIDPLDKLIDRNPDDNLIKVEKK
ncbi:MAG: ABC transporter permease [Terriglobales bacterium]